ncbi:MAG: aspartate kinase [Ignavibacteria bacterium]|nr:aspartate kinase [Ignavibacteria bacterium]
MIVMKFGGTSVEDAAAMKTMCDIVRMRAKKKPVVVLSAVSGSTNTLIRCAELAAGGQEPEAQALLKTRIIDRHFEIIQGLINGLREQDGLIREVNGFFDELRHLLYGISITGDLSPRVLDFVMSYGERMFGTVLNADDIEIWTDVDGILTADPKLVPHALRVKEMSFQEASELAYFGAKVLHPSTLLPAIDKNIPVHIYNSKRPQAGGTLIKARIVPSHVAVKSISYKRGITVMNISSARMLGSYGFMKKIFDIFSEHHTSVDLVTTSEVSVSLSVDYTPSLDALVQDLEEYGRVQIQRNKAIVCIVGEKLKSEKGIAARVFGRLRDIPIDMISQGASEINITFVVDESSIPTAVRELHDEFFSTVPGKGVFE